MSQRTREITDPAMAPIKAWIESYVMWTDLPAEVRRDIATRAHRGDEAAIEQMCNHNLRLVLACAVKLVDRGLPLNDLFQEGWFGLRTAAQKYDPDRGNQFSTMATWWIRRTMNDALITQGRTVYLPHKADERLARIATRAKRGEELRADDQRWMDRLARQLSKNPKLTGVSIDYFDHLLRGPVSLDKSIAHISHGGVESDHTLADVIAAPAERDTTESLDLEALLLEMYNRKAITQLEGWLLVRMTGMDGRGGITNDEAARALYDAGVAKSTVKDAPLSRQRIDQIMSRALRKVRQYVGAATWQSAANRIEYRKQRKGLSGAPSAGQSESTESPHNRSATSYEHSSNRNSASRSAAAPTPLRAHDSTQRRKGSIPPTQNNRSQRKDQGVPPALPYAEAI